MKKNLEISHSNSAIFNRESASLINKPLTAFFLICIFIFTAHDKAISRSTHNHGHNPTLAHADNKVNDYPAADSLTASRIHSHNHGNEHASARHNHHPTHLNVDYSFQNESRDYQEPKADDDGYFWWKGNLHTHSFWSDGDQFPEVIAEWYYEHGYHFLTLSDHNILSQGGKWINRERIEQRTKDDVLDLYKKSFGDDWVETRETNGELEVRLKPLTEVRALFERAGRFIMIQSEEITQREHVIHVNATNILEFIEPKPGKTVEETIRLNIDAVVEQGEQSGQEMIPHLNHPNFRTAVTAEDMAPVENMRLFEIYNGHRGVLNYGDDDGTQGLDRVWDIVLTKRLGELNLGLLYGVATDDAHSYETSTSEVSVPGRGWVVVRSRFLTPESIVRGLKNGDFYSSSGVTINSFEADEKSYRVEVDPEEGVEYTIQFIGTRKGYNPASELFVDSEGQKREDKTRIYSDDIGEVFKEVKGTRAEYKFSGDELYVRARVISSKVKENYFEEGEKEQAWLQPVRVSNL